MVVCRQLKGDIVQAVKAVYKMQRIIHYRSLNSVSETRSAFYFLFMLQLYAFCAHNISFRNVGEW